MRMNHVQPYVLCGVRYGVGCDMCSVGCCELCAVSCVMLYTSGFPFLSRGIVIPGIGDAKT